MNLHLITLGLIILKMIGVPYIATASWWLIFAPSLVALSLLGFALVLGLFSVGLYAILKK